MFPQAPQPPCWSLGLILALFFFFFLNKLVKRIVLHNYLAIPCPSDWRNMPCWGQKEQPVLGCIWHVHLRSCGQANSAKLCKIRDITLLGTIKFSSWGTLICLSNNTQSLIFPLYIWVPMSIRTSPLPVPTTPQEWCSCSFHYQGSKSTQKLEMAVGCIKSVWPHQDIF